jgi:hypothetical protein
VTSSWAGIYCLAVSITPFPLPSPVSGRSAPDVDKSSESPPPGYAPGKGGPPGVLALEDMVRVEIFLLVESDRDTGGKARAEVVSLAHSCDGVNGWCSSVGALDLEFIREINDGCNKAVQEGDGAVGRGDDIPP